MADLACPRHVANVQQTIDTLFQFDECTVVGQVANLTSDHCAFAVLVGNGVPWVGHGLLDTQRQLLSSSIDAQDLDIDLVADVDHLVGMIDATSPGHFADVDQAFDARFQLDECTVAHHVDNFALDDRTHWVLLDNVFPWVLLLLLQTQSDLLLFAIDLQNLDLDLLIDSNHLRWMANAFPAHIGDVQQTIDTAQVDERTEVGDVLDDTFAELANFQFRQQMFAIFFALLFDQRTTADDDIATGFVDLEHFALNDAADKVGDVVRPADIHLAGWQEDGHADVDQQTTFDLASNGTGDDLAFFDGPNCFFPLNDLLSFALAEADHAVNIVGRAQFVFHLFDQHLDDAADDGLFIGLGPFAAIDSPFALETNVDYDEVFGNFHDLAVNDLVDAKIGDFTKVGLHPVIEFFFGQQVSDLLIDGVIFQRANEIAINHKRNCPVRLQIPSWRAASQLAAVPRMPQKAFQREEGRGNC